MLNQNNDLDMREFLGIDKVLQITQGDLVNNASKLTVNHYVKKIGKS